MITPWYDLMSGMCREIGETLIHWSKNLHSYVYEYGEDEWRATLYMHGCTLLRYGGERVVDNASDEDWTLRSERGIFISEYDVAEKEAKASLRWVVDNFEHMWD